MLLSACTDGPVADQYNYETLFIGLSQAQQDHSDLENSRSCHVLLEPLDSTGSRENESSKVLDIICSSEEISVSELTSYFGTLATYKVAQFWDGSYLTGQSISYYGTYQCTQGYSYGVLNLYQSGWDNRFSSAATDTGGCPYGQVFDRAYYGTPMYSFSAMSLNLHSMSNATTSWRVCASSSSSGCLSP